MFARCKEDIRAVKDRDPAATSGLSIILNYPGVQAVWQHRFEHWLWNKNRRGIARFLSQCTRFFTGVEIHPGAQIGRRVFIDHGMGVVIGETSIVGDDVTIYQGVTLGGTGKESGKRHPTVEDKAVIGVGASVLGNITVGAGSMVGGGAVVIDDVPTDTTVVGIPGHVVVQNGKRVDPIDLHHERLPDPVVDMIRRMQHRIERLEKRIALDESAHANVAPADIAVCPEDCSCSDAPKCEIEEIQKADPASEKNTGTEDTDGSVSNNKEKTLSA